MLFDSVQSALSTSATTHFDLVLCHHRISLAEEDELLLAAGLLLGVD